MHIQCGAFPLPRSWQRLLLISLVIFIPLGVYLLLIAGGTGPTTIALRFHQDKLNVSTPYIGRCSHGERSSWAKSWNMTERNHRDLIDDRFTIALSTSHQTKELQRTLDILLSNKIHSLLEIVIIWNNRDEDMPDGYVSSHGVEVRYRKPLRDSLNEKLWNDPSYRTRAILLSDDDIFYRPADLDFVFNMWRRFGRDRVTGALARCAHVNPAGQWEYSLCRPGAKYALVLTNLAFVDVSLLDAYNSEFELVQEMRGFVDKASNCEDIALNFVAAARLAMLDSRATRAGGPLLVRGSEQYLNLNPLAAITRQKNHLETRSNCLNHFANAFGCMPLVDEVARIEYGVKDNEWYETLADGLRQ